MSYFPITINNMKKIKEALGLENEWEERRALFGEMWGKASLRTGHRSSVTSAESESRIAQHLRPRA